MLEQEDLIRTPEYWLETIQDEIYRQVSAYLKDNNLTQSQLAIQLGVSKGYISQVMKGEFNYTLKKLIELSLAVGKAPVLVLKPLEGITPISQKEIASSFAQTLNRVADPIEPYPLRGK